MTVVDQSQKSLRQKFRVIVWNGWRSGGIIAVLLTQVSDLQVFLVLCLSFIRDLQLFVNLAQESWCDPSGYNSWDVVMMGNVLDSGIDGHREGTTDSWLPWQLAWLAWCLSSFPYQCLDLQRLLTLRYTLFISTALGENNNFAHVYFVKQVKMQMLGLGWLCS